jgi:uncharacterized protein (TIGR02646 family)
MRYVDNELLALPAGWQEKAETALNELRSEVEQAEAAAREAGEDAAGIATARKRAISEGLKRPSRERLWRDLAVELGKLKKGKCWYSESKNPASDKDVDHFRPKGRVDEDDSHEGYWWLAFAWQNYRYSSQWCNQKRNDTASGTSGGKRDSFPLSPGSFRARQETDPWESEEVELLDPTDPDDWKLLTFRPDGYPIPAKPEGTPEHRRAKTSILIYHLHCKELVDDRRPLAGQIKRLVEELEALRPNIVNDPQIKKIFKMRQGDLLRAIHSDSEYSAAALAYARAEIHTTRYGRPIKREWLEEMIWSAVPC